MEGVAGRALTIGAAARTPLSLAGPASFEFCQSAPGRCRVRRFVAGGSHEEDRPPRARTTFGTTAR